MALRIPENPRHGVNQRRYPCEGDESPCIVCGKALKEPRWLLNVINGGHDIATDEPPGDIDEAGDLYWLPIGTDCLRRHPELKPWAVPVEQG